MPQCAFSTRKKHHHRGYKNGNLSPLFPFILGVAELNINMNIETGCLEKYQYCEKNYIERCRYNVY